MLALHLIICITADDCYDSIVIGKTLTRTRSRSPSLAATQMFLLAEAACTIVSIVALYFGIYFSL